MSSRKASIKETGEELSQEDWARFDAAVAKVQAERPKAEGRRPPAEPEAATPTEDHPRR